MSVTANEFEQMRTLAIEAIRSFAEKHLRGQRLEKLTLSGSLAAVAATRSPIGITTITISRQTSNGFADAVIFDIIEQSAELGVRGSQSRRVYYTAKADADDRIGSDHPTVKPVDLMQYLVRLVTPKGGTVLDPFAGTGTTGEAAWREGMNAILIERDETYLEDIARRMDLATKPSKRQAVAATKNKIDDLGPLFSGGK